MILKIILKIYYILRIKRQKITLNIFARNLNAAFDSLLDQTRNHPRNLTILPGMTKCFNALGQSLYLTFSPDHPI